MRISTCFGIQQIINYVIYSGGKTVLILLITKKDHVPNPEVYLSSSILLIISSSGTLVAMVLIIYVFRQHSMVELPSERSLDR